MMHISLSFDCYLLHLLSVSLWLEKKKMANGIRMMNAKCWMFFNVQLMYERDCISKWGDFIPFRFGQQTKCQHCKWIEIRSLADRPIAFFFTHLPHTATLYLHFSSNKWIIANILHYYFRFTFLLSHHDSRALHRRYRCGYLCVNVWWNSVI